jgi:acyl-CoA-binding protein
MKDGEKYWNDSSEKYGSNEDAKSSYLELVDEPNVGCKRKRVSK